MTTARIITSDGRGWELDEEQYRKFIQTDYRVCVGCNLEWPFWTIDSHMTCASCRCDKNLPRLRMMESFVYELVQRFRTDNGFIDPTVISRIFRGLEECIANHVEIASYYDLERKTERDRDFRWQAEIAKFYPSINFMSFSSPEYVIPWLFKELGIEPRQTPGK